MWKPVPRSFLGLPFLQAVMKAFPIEGVPEIREGDDIGAIIQERTSIEPGDIVCVASTIVSKAEGRKRNLSSYHVSETATQIAQDLEEITGESKDPRFAQAIIEESEELLLTSPFLLTVTKFGHITVNAGIDRSNVPDADILLLPSNPKRSAEDIHNTIGTPVIVTDTSGRPFRYGQRGVAIGWAGMPAARDWRGETDRDGRTLDVTVQAVVDELAATANLITGEGAGGTPIVIIRGWEFGTHEGHKPLFRTAEDDIIRQALREWE